MIASKGFRVVSVSVTRVTFPVLDLVVKLFIRLGHLEPDPGFFQRHRLFREG